MNDRSASVEDLGIDPTEVEAHIEASKSWMDNPDKAICICGHALTRHTISETSVYCTVAKAWCSCFEPIAVLVTEDLRPFIYSTTGVGKKHALAKGLYTLRKNEKSARWLIERFCFRCKAEDQTLFPTALTRDKRIAKNSGYSNALLCEACVIDLGGYPSYY